MRVATSSMDVGVGSRVISGRVTSVEAAWLGITMF